MKLSTAIIAGVAAIGALGAFEAASAATVFEHYNGYADAAYLNITNDSGGAYTDVTVSGGYGGQTVDFGALASGAQTGDFYFGDCENYGFCNGAATVTVTVGGKMYSGSFADQIGDVEIDTPQMNIGELPTGVPEPAAWALMLVGFAGLGATLRSSRKTLAKA
jgi:hypothetical protein